MKPTVSAVITTYNYGRFLKEALDSVLRQTVQEVEVVVIDDGSTDHTPAVIAPYLRDPRVCYRRTDHQGVVAAKNAGIRQATAPFIAFLDADDSWLQGKLKRQLQLFAADPDLGVVYTRRLLVDEDGHELEYEQPAMSRGRILESLFRTNYVCFSSSMVARPVFDTVGLLDPETAPSEDYDFWLRVARRYRFDYVDAPLVRYRTGHASLSRRQQRLGTVLRIMQRFLDEHGGREQLSPSAIRAAFADTYCNLGLAERSVSPLAACRWYLRALAEAPLWGPAWKGLASALLPEIGRRGLRRLLGRPLDWSVRPRVSAG
jgi:glycosyltransferase involved in cell wall biosynthesis